MALSIVKTTSKLAVGAGVVYLTFSQGIWSTTHQGSRALNEMRRSVLPAADKYIQQVPKAEEVNNKMVESWNCGVQMTFDVLARTPEIAYEYSKMAVDTLKENIK